RKRQQHRNKQQKPAIRIDGNNNHDKKENKNEIVAKHEKANPEKSMKKAAKDGGDGGEGGGEGGRFAGVKRSNGEDDGGGGEERER
ncbi:hypothetical protein PJM26_30960, partial [Mycobacterium kansasii]